MAKKTPIKQYHIHRYCKHCCPVVDEFLSIQGGAVLGGCKFEKYRFLLNDKTECNEYAEQRDGLLG